MALLSARKSGSLLVLAISLLLTGCATTEYRALPSAPSSKPVSPSATLPKATPLPPKPIAPSAIKKDGIYHKVEKGQTLFRIAKAYGLDVDTLIAANNIPNAAAIEVNQLILIPGAKAQASPGVASADPNKDEFAWPIRGKVISYFNDHKGDAVSKGVDIEGTPGEAVMASREGKVVLSDYLGSWGYTVILDHGDGFLSVYAKLAQSHVKVGDHVLKGVTLAQIAQIGRRSMLHFQIRKGQLAVNPLYYLP